MIFCFKKNNKKNFSTLNEQRPPGEYHGQVGSSDIWENFLSVSATTSGLSARIGAAGRVHAHAHARPPSVHSQEFSRCELGWKTIADSHWVKRTLGPWAWLLEDDGRCVPRLRERNDKDPLFRKLLSTRGGPITTPLGGETGELPQV